MILKGFEENKKCLEGRKIFLVCGKSFDTLCFASDIKALNPVRFGDFTPNPKYEEVMLGVDEFKKSKCDLLLAVGGGSAIDVAKCIKRFAKSDAEIIAIPTTSGTGSESTRFAVMYKDGVKQSVTGDELLPDTAILEPRALENVPEYTRKSTMLDALCHAIESFWAVRSTDQSRKLAKKAIMLILAYKEEYLNNTFTGNEKMLEAANLAGQAINITTTTAAHALCYKLTSLYNIPHGHAASLCLGPVWRFLIKNNDNSETVTALSELTGIIKKCKNPNEKIYDQRDMLSAVDDYNQFVAELSMKKFNIKGENLRELTTSVNVERLSNFPLSLTEDDILNLYLEIKDLAGEKN